MTEQPDELEQLVTDEDVDIAAGTGPALPDDTMPELDPDIIE